MIFWEIKTVHVLKEGEIIDHVLAEGESKLYKFYLST